MGALVKPHAHETPKAPTGKAAFFDIDGTLISTNVVHAYGYYAMNEGSVGGILKRTLGTVAKLPVFAGLNVVDRKIFNEYFYRQYEGLTEDRLLTLSEDLFEDVIKAAIFKKAQDLLDEARRAGCKVVLVTGALDFTMRPLARHFGVDDMIANRMQYVGGKATGKVIPPIIEGANKANVIREYCETHGISLMKSYAYTDSASDYAMLTVVGRPTAVNPDIRLRALARSYNWPILDVR
ncbi:MAG: HAD-IB family hydrolase [Archangium gephyra]|uniref:HAD-IB family hydrolase n=1 Tax=Archangium gephyra TaxID=48 RepID=A0A2W5TWA2_9BACT|nr:MAG: HAD-IB family hydrolase [Archangium gephyra]